MEQGVCPICGSTDLVYRNIELEGESVYFPFRCLECGAKGNEVYETIFSGFEDIETNIVNK